MFIYTHPRDRGNPDKGLLGGWGAVLDMVIYPADDLKLLQRDTHHPFLGILPLPCLPCWPWQTWFSSYPLGSTEVAFS